MRFQIAVVFRPSKDAANRWNAPLGVFGHVSKLAQVWTENSIVVFVYSKNEATADVWLYKYKNFIRYEKTKTEEAENVLV